MDKVIITSPQELSTLIEDSVKRVLSDTIIPKAESQEFPELLSIDLAAAYLNLAKQTIYGFTSKGEIPFLKRGKKLYFKKSELTKWIHEGKKV
jgi:excisionase family DNA binding protein